MLTWGREKVMRRMDVVLDNAGWYGGTADGFPFDEGDSVAGKEAVL